MKRTPLVMQFLARLAHALLTGAKAAEVLSRLGNNISAELWIKGIR